MKAPNLRITCFVLVLIPIWFWFSILIVETIHLFLYDEYFTSKVRVMLVLSMWTFYLPLFCCLEYIKYKLLKEDKLLTRWRY